MYILNWCVYVHVQRVPAMCYAKVELLVSHATVHTPTHTLQKTIYARIRMAYALYKYTISCVFMKSGNRFERKSKISET